MKDPSDGRAAAWLSRRSVLAVMVGLAATVGLVAALLATGGAVSGQSGPASAQAEPEVPVEEALAKPQTPLPEGMPTEKPKAIGKPLDPLSGEEVGYARGLALTAAGTGGERVDGSAGLQYLSTDLAESDAEAPKRAVTVNSYDYATDELVTQVVDLQSGAVDTKRAKGVQLPPSKREVDTAMVRLLADPEGQALKDDYKATTGVALTSPDQLDYAGGAWVADEKSEGGEQCGEHRCVFFQIRTEDGRGLIMVDRVVDLSADKIEVIKP
ncbi:Tat pathway signal sequence domain protein [Solirubrobacter sp. CPCC 204708]|nr:Tat pathway signal sequence domain protein [Solirubrobacter deserti]